MARLDKNEAIILEMWTLLNRIETALVVKDPGTQVSADAYDGLRKLVLQSAKNRRIHISHLLSLADSLGRDASMQLIKDRVHDFMTELGVSYFSDTSQEELFEIVSGEGSALECVEPAVVERLEDGRIVEVRRGTARRIPGPDPEPEPTPATGEKSTDSLETDTRPQVESSDSQTASTSDNVATTVSPRRPSATILLIVASVLAGFLIGLLASSGSDSSPSKPNTTTTSVPATSTTVGTTTTTEAGQ